MKIKNPKKGNRVVLTSRVDMRSTGGPHLKRGMSGTIVRGHRDATAHIRFDSGEFECLSFNKIRVI